jgi:hypothetical protein
MFDSELEGTPVDRTCQAGKGSPLQSPRDEHPDAVTVPRRTALLVGATLAVIAFYVVVYPLHGYRVALGSDTPVYVWWSRYAEATGLGGLGTGPRAGIVGPLAVLSTIMHIAEADLVAALGAVLAVALALAAAAFTEEGIGRRDGRSALIVLLTGSFLSIMAPGYFSTLAFGAAFLAGLAVLVAGLEDRSWVPVATAAALFGASGLSHALFLLLGALVMAGGMVALIRPSRRAVMAGGRWIETPLARAASASLGGVAVVTAGLAAMGSLADVTSAGADRLATARDTVLRRLGLSSLLEASYRRKLVHDFPWYRALVVVGAAVLPFASRRGRGTIAAAAGEPSVRPRFFWGTVSAWLAVSAAGVIGLLLGFGSPGQRLAAFCVPLPVLAGAGLWAWLGAAPRRRTGTVLLVLAAIGYAAIAWMAWNGQKALATPAAIRQARQIGAALGRQPPGTPLILVVDNAGDKPGLFVVRSLNYVRAAVPSERVPDVYAFVGSAADLVAGQPTLTGRREHDVMATAFWRELQPLLSRRPLAVSVEAFDGPGYQAARASPGVVPIGPGVVTIAGFEGNPCAPGCAPIEEAAREPGPGPFSPWQPVWTTPLLFILLGLAGIPWAATVGPPRRALLLAPAFGLAALALASVVVDAIGLRLASAGGWVAFGLAVGGGVLAFSVRWGRPGRTATTEPPPPDPPPR